MLYNINDSLPLTLGSKVEVHKPAPPEWKETHREGLFVHRDTGLMKYSGGGHEQITEDQCSKKPKKPKKLIRDMPPMEVLKVVTGEPRVVSGRTPDKPGWYMASAATLIDPDPEDFLWARYWNGKTWSCAVGASDGRLLVEAKKKKVGIYHSATGMYWLEGAPVHNPYCV